jgi:hypothetical protein
LDDGIGQALAGQRFNERGHFTDVVAVDPALYGIRTDTVAEMLP